MTISVGTNFTGMHPTAFSAARLGESGAKAFDEEEEARKTRKDAAALSSYEDYYHVAGGCPAETRATGGTGETETGRVRTDHHVSHCSFFVRVVCGGRS